jgi:small-conductance mechanosensitive channel
MKPAARRLVTCTPTGARQLTVLLLTVLVAATTAWAQDDGRATVRVDGRTVFRVGEAGGLDASGRARRIERRLNTLLETPEAVVPARVEGASDTARIVTVAGVPVVTVTVADAEDNLVGMDALAARWAGSIDRVLIPARDRRTTAWGRFSADVRASVQAAFARLLESAIRIIPRALAALLVIGLFWAIATGVRRLMRAVFKRVIADLTVENLLKQFTYYAVWALGLIVAIDALGFDPETVVTGLGLTGLALGFALKDIISNFVSGILILTLRPFRLGDQIIVGETEGNVERIQLRATEIRTYDGRLVLVPNAEVFTARVTNNTASPVRRGSVQLFVGYEVEPARVAELVRAATQSAPGVLAEPPAYVRVVELGQDDLVMEARFWTDSRRSDFLDTASAVRTAVVEALRDADIGLPDPDVRFIVPRAPGRARRQSQVEERLGGDRDRACAESRGMAE